MTKTYSRIFSRKQNHRWIKEFLSCQWQWILISPAHRDPKLAKWCVSNHPSTKQKCLLQLSWSYYTVRPFFFYFIDLENTESYDSDGEDYPSSRGYKYWVGFSELMRLWIFFSLEGRIYMSYMWREQWAIWWPQNQTDKNCWDSSTLVFLPFPGHTDHISPCISSRWGV